VAAVVSPVRRVFAPLSLLAAVALLGGCGQQDPRDWGDDLKANFVEGCTKEVTLAADGKSAPKVTELAAKSRCECVYDKAKNKYGLKFSDLKDYEDKVQSMKDGQPPDMPAKLKQAVEDPECSGVGPAPEDAVTTTSAGSTAAPTTTKG
jgi:hypothetical protein